MYSDGLKFISSGEVKGFIHKARTEKPSCLNCKKDVEKGQYYVLFNYPFALGAGFLWHLICYDFSEGYLAYKKIKLTRTTKQWLVKKFESAKEVLMLVEGEKP